MSVHVDSHPGVKTLKDLRSIFSPVTDPLIGTRCAFPGLFYIHPLGLSLSSPVFQVSTKLCPQLGLVKLYQHGADYATRALVTVLQLEHIDAWQIRTGQSEEESIQQFAKSDYIYPDVCSVRYDFSSKSLVGSEFEVLQNMLFLHFPPDQCIKQKLIQAHLPYIHRKDSQRSQQRQCEKCNRIEVSVCESFQKAA